MDEAVRNKIMVKVDPDLAEIIPGFLENRRTDIRQIQAALKQRDYEGIKRLGHIMKGAGGGYGFDVITEIGAGLEEKAEKKDEDSIRKGIDRLALYLDQVEVIYE